jgi:4-alpha-glucanotransferase
VVELRKEYEAWRAEADTQEWLEAAAIFSAISGRPENLGKDWWSWTEELRDRDEAALAAIAQEQKAEIDEYCVLQFLFDSQVG